MELIQKYHFYINLEKRIEKKIQCEKELKKIGLKPNRFNAIEHEIGLVGCVKSHIKCIEIAKERNYPLLCIFEDDISFIDSDKLISYINKYITIDYDVLYLGAWISDNKYKIINDDLLHINKATTTHAYIIKNHYYDTIIENYNEGMKLKLQFPDEEKYNIDHYNYKLQNIDKWYCFNPILVTQLDGYSDNFNNITTYENFITSIPNKDKDLPKISLVTITENFNKFIPLLISNIKYFDYPKKKIEWVILDTCKKRFYEIEKLISFLNIEIKYYHNNNNKLNLLEKKNLLCNNCKYDILVTLSEDSIYLKNYIRHSVDLLLNKDKDIIGCLDMVYIHPYDNYKVSIFKNSDIYYESTLCMKKKYWNKYEKYYFIKGGLKSNICYCTIEVCWDKNISDSEYHSKKKEINFEGEQFNILKKIFRNEIKMENTKDEKVEITLKLLQDIRNIIEVANDRINWKIDELLPIGLVIKEIDELLKKEVDS